MGVLLNKEEKEMLKGKHGEAVRKSMEMLIALGEIYGAERLIPVSSVQIAGVSYHNIGDEGLEFLEDMAKDGRVRVLATLNPAGMDTESWSALGIPSDFAEKQIRIISAFERMGVLTTCTCTPYLIGNLPRFKEHAAWSESSAVCFANSVIGARTNREGGPSALAAALTGRTAEYGMHVDANRRAGITVEVKAKIRTEADFGALAYAIAKKIDGKIPYIRGIKTVDFEQLKIFCAAIATYAGVAMFHMEGITPDKTPIPKKRVRIETCDLREAYENINDEFDDVDFVSVGCPHCSIHEIEKIAKLVSGKKVKSEFWITTARSTKKLADMLGYTKVIEDAGGKFVCDTCMVVAPLKGRFKTLVTNSAKACYYGRGSNNFKVKLAPLEKCVEAAVMGRWK
ncbi:MAG: aconitase X catalytic domain-containing protein [Candidatus Micrarchaeia archaeon]